MVRSQHMFSTPKTSPLVAKGNTKNKMNSFQNGKPNPFSRPKMKENYPGLDEVFNFSIKKPHVSSPPRYSSPDRCSTNLSELNMSIGARAAITEHTRHISKFGIDGTKSIKYADRSHNDDEWDRLMDETTISHVSFSINGEDSESKVIHPSGKLISQLRNSPLHENETLDMTYDQSDFFNSSRINCLQTPERNKPKVDEASRLARLGVGVPTHRGAEISNYYTESISGSTDASRTVDQSGMVGLFNNALRLGEESEAFQGEEDDFDENVQDSFISYREPDLSLLSFRESRFSDDPAGDDKISCTSSKISKQRGNERSEFDNDTSTIFLQDSDSIVGKMRSRGLSDGDQTLCASPETSFVRGNGKDEFDADVSTIFLQENNNLTPVSKVRPVNSSSNMISISKLPTDRIPSASPKGSDLMRSTFGADMSVIKTVGDYEKKRTDNSEIKEDFNITNRATVPDIYKPITGNSKFVNEVDELNRNSTKHGTKSGNLNDRYCDLETPNETSVDLSPAIKFPAHDLVSWPEPSPVGANSDNRRNSSNSDPETFARNLSSGGNLSPNMKNLLHAEEILQTSEKVNRTPSRSSSRISVKESNNGAEFSGISPVSRLDFSIHKHDDNSHSPIPSPVANLNESLFSSVLTDIPNNSLNLSSYHQQSEPGNIKSDNRRHKPKSLDYSNEIDVITAWPESINGDMPNDDPSQLTPPKSRLSERFFRSDRFEDKFTAPAPSLLTSTSSEESKFGNDNSVDSVSKSLFETFEEYSYSYSPSGSPRQFDV